MKLTRVFLVFVLLIVFVQVGAAAPEVTVSGYVDTLVDLGNLNAINPYLNITEVGVSAKIVPWLSADVLVGYYSDPVRTATGTAAGFSLESFEPGWATLTAFKEEGDSKMSLTIGYFDVPVGLASFWYGSPDNAFAYAPGLTSFLTGEWTDVGAMGTYEAESFSLTAFLVKGAPLVDPMDVAPKGLAGGLRATFTPSEGITLGASYALNGCDINGNSSILAGDIECELGMLSLAFEWLAIMPKFEFGDRKDAWFLQAMFNLQEVADVPISLGARFDYLTESLSTNSKAGTALTLQAAYAFEEYLRIGLSYQIVNDEIKNNGEDNRFLLQFLTMF